MGCGFFVGHPARRSGVIAFTELVIGDSSACD